MTWKSRRRLYIVAAGLDEDGDIVIVASSSYVRQSSNKIGELSRNDLLMLHVASIGYSDSSKVAYVL